MLASSSLGPVCSSTWFATIVAAPAAPRSGTGAAVTVGRGATGRLGAEALRAEGHEVRPGPVNVVVTSWVPPNTGVVDLHRVAVDGELDVVRQHRAIELDREPADDVAADVVLREQHEVGGVAARDHRVHRRGDGDTG